MPRFVLCIAVCFTAACGSSSPADDIDVDVTAVDAGPTKDASSADPSADGAVPSQPTVGTAEAIPIVSGRRLNAGIYRSGTAEMFSVWLDSTRSETCQFRTASDGALRC